MEKKRSGPGRVAPVSYKGIRYEALNWGKARGLEQNGGYITAVDEKTGQELWFLKVYDVSYDGNMEEDKQDVFIIKLTVSRLRNRLTVKNERGESFAISLKDRTVTPL